MPRGVKLPRPRVGEGYRVANNRPYGLSAGVWSRDIDTCLTIARGMRAGTIWVNSFMEGYPELPFGGYKRPGHGRELGKRAVEDYTEKRQSSFIAAPAPVGGWVELGAPADFPPVSKQQGR